jgi:NAD(P)-dependent dehydrogenase (short-subunit alcohol dehydrogenase family)
MPRYSGKNIVVTGGSSGIGFAMARLLADGGAHVVITGRSRTALDAARERLGENAVAVRAWTPLRTGCGTSSARSTHSSSMRVSRS